MLNEVIKTINGSYKKGVLGKKNDVLLNIFEKHIEGIGHEYYSNEFHEKHFSIDFENIKKIAIKEIKNNYCLVIDYASGLVFFQEEVDSTIYLMNIEEIEDVMQLLCDLWDKCNREKNIRLQQENERKEKQRLYQQRYAEECRQYYNECYDFHILNNNNPYYELKRDELVFIGIYVDKDRNLNFVSIDGNKKQESNACITYEKIHYFEKAGSIHYTSQINGNFSNFGGSFKGGTISKSAAAIAGLLFGPMGMAAGALFSHKPPQIEFPKISFDISTETKQIDDRSVILNYYSDAKRQLMDIELPSDIYNFLQTFLPDKKYGIVLEIEKEQALEKKNESVAEIEGSKNVGLAVNDDMQAFEKKIKKLVIMRENGLLSDMEFEAEKNKILNEL